MLLASVRAENIWGDAHNEYQSALVAEGLDRGMTAAQIADAPEVALNLMQVEVMIKLSIFFPEVPRVFTCILLERYV